MAGTSKINFGGVSLGRNPAGAWNPHIDGGGAEELGGARRSPWVELTKGVSLGRLECAYSR